MIQRKDTFALTPAQVDSLNAASRRYAVAHDSLVTDLARYLLTRHGDFSGEEVRDQWHATGVAIYERIVDLAAAARGVFTETQMVNAARHDAVHTGGSGGVGQRTRRGVGVSVGCTFDLTTPRVSTARNG